MRLPDNHCNNLEAFLDGRIEDEACNHFESHLAECDDCSHEVEHWQEVKQAYSQWVDTNTGSHGRDEQRMAAPAFASRILERMEAEKTTSKRPKPGVSRIYLFAAAAAIVLGLFGIINFVDWSTQTKSDIPAQTTRPSQRLPISVVTITNGNKTTGFEKVEPGTTLEAPARGRMLASVQEDRLGLGESSAVRVAEIGSDQIVFLMSKGTVAFEVSKKSDGYRFVVEAGEVTVEVIGTRFFVAITDNQTVTVCVEEGAVEVKSEEWRITLNEGKSITVAGGVPSPVTDASDLEIETMARLLSDNAATSPGAVEDPINHSMSPAVPPLSKPKLIERRSGPTSPTKDNRTWRELIINGDIQEASKQITGYLRAVPKDAEALMLLATCQKRAGQYIEAVESYRRVSVSGDEKHANRARYLAGELSLSKLKEFQGAAAFFNDYLKNTPPSAPNSAKAKLGLAKSLLGTGDSARARQILTRIVAEYGRTPIANKARELLGQLHDEKRTPE